MSRIIQSFVVRALALLLLALILLTLALIAAELQRWHSERTYFEGRADDYAAMATEIAFSRPAAGSSNHLLAARLPQVRAQAGATPDPNGGSQAPRLPTVIFMGDPRPGQVDITAIPPRLEPLDRRGHDLVNILLLCSDSELGFENQRTDTIILL